MNKTRKVELLYKKAKNKYVDASPEELKELNKYKINVNEIDFVTTKKNIQDYVSAVDNGCNISFYDWCMNNNRADRRRKGSSEQELQRFNQEQNATTMFIGWLTWGLAIYWIFHGALPAGACAIMGAITSYIIFRRSRLNAAFTIVLLPVILAVIFGR